MDIQPQLFRATPEAQDWNRPLAELPLERQVDLLGRQMMQYKQLLAMQQWQLAAGADMQVGLEAQSIQLQAIALETNQAANARIANTEQALTEKTKECLAQEARIAMLEAQLASSQAAHAAVDAAAEQTIETQAKTIDVIKEDNAILTKAFKTTEKVTHDISVHRLHSSPLGNWQISYLYTKQVSLPAFNALALQVSETRAELQQNIQNKTP